MATRPRRLINNSLGSVLASGTLIFSTVLVPAVLARGLSRAQFDAYAIVLASLPLILIVPQSMRTVGATQLALALAKYGEDSALRAYSKFASSVLAAHVLLSAIGIEIYVAISKVSVAVTELRFGLYCILGYTVGLIAVGFVAAPAAAQQNFLPDNVAKFWPGLFQLAGVIAVWFLGVDGPLVWIFVIYVLSSWSVVAVLLALRSTKRPKLSLPEQSPAGLTRDLFQGLRGVLWWNLTAYFATTAAIMVVAIGFPSSIVPFSIATSLLGIVSAALVAVSGPVAVHAAASQQHTADARRHLFLIVNSLFQAYIVTTALVIVVAPTALYVLWLTPALAADVKWFTILLLPATVIRLLTMNFTIFVMSVGRQQTLWLSPLIEAILSLVGSLVLGSLLGIIGIPLALCASAIVRLLLTLLHDEPLTRSALALAPGDVLLSVGRLVRGVRADLS